PLFSPPDCYGGPPAPHSFPTRRSSDLSWRAPATARRPPASTGAPAAAARTTSTRSPSSPPRRWCGCCPGTRAVRAARPDRPGGRLRARVRLGVGGPQPFRGDVGVPLGGGQGGVTEHLLDGAQVGAAGEQVGRRAVAQAVRGEVAHAGERGETVHALPD